MAGGRDVVRSAPSVRRPRARTLRDGALTFVFTDIESSTATGSRIGDVAFHALLAPHKERLRATVGAHNGRVVKDQGDGLMIVFGSAHAAITCAIEMQRECAEQGDLRLKIGVNSGEVVVERGDYQGLAVNIASRLSKVAAGDE